jgi:serine/alanine adding enzyme
MSWVAFDERLVPAWDAFVASAPGGRAVHFTGFKRAVERVYRLAPFYRAYLDGAGAVRAVFPGFFHASRLYGRKIVSQPFSEYGGLLLAPDLGGGERERILDEFRALALEALRRTGFAHLEMRFPMSLPEGDARFRTLPLFKTTVRPIQDRDTMWKALAAKDRNVIRRAQEYGLSFAEHTDEETIRWAFYPLYQRTMKRLGSPPHPLAYFLEMARELPASMKVFIVSLGKRPVSALVAWAAGRTLHVTDMVSDEAAFFLKPNDLAVWEFLGWAADRGFDLFDFGPVRYRGQEIFKMKWRMELHDYSYRYLSLRPCQPRNPVSGGGGLMAAAPGVWRAAVPLNLARWAGRRLRREIGL